MKKHCFAWHFIIILFLLSANAPVFSATETDGGMRHSIARKDNGTVWTWGYNGHGQLGTGDSLSSTEPLQVPDPGGMGYFSDVLSVAAGAYHSLALKEDGTVWAWGFNWYGQLGDGTAILANIGRTRPVQVLGPGGSGFLNQISDIAAGAYHNLALKDDGTVWAWGFNTEGQLGNNDNTATSVPVQVLGPGGSGFLTGITAIAAGYRHSLALKNDGTVWAWGFNEYSQLGNGTRTDSWVPVQVHNPDGSGFLTGITDISAGSRQSLALHSDGSLWSWGFNRNGQIGNGSFLTASRPVQVVNTDQSGFLTDIIQALCENDSALALKNDGTVWTWGVNRYGQLGNGTTVYHSPVPVQVSGPGGAGVLTDISNISAGGDHMLARQNSFLTAWGGNIYGQLGDGSSTGSNVPVQVVEDGEYFRFSTAEIYVSGNAQDIANGDITPAASDGTAFGYIYIEPGLSPVTHSFIIENRGTSDLLLTLPVSLSGDTAFSVVTQPSATVPPGGSTSFDLRFLPSSVGEKTADISVVNNDDTDNPFVFRVQGYGYEDTANILFVQSPPDTETGDTARLTAYVQNAGIQPLTASAEIRFHVDGPGYSGWLGQTSLAGLGASSYVWSYYFWILPADLDPGLYTFYTQAFNTYGPISGVSSSGSFTVTATVNDAEVTRLMPVPATSAGAKVMLKVLVKNNMTVPLAAGSHTEYFISGPSYPTPVSVGTVSSAGLAAGSSRWYFIYWDIPSGILGGTYRYSAQVKDGVGDPLSEMSGTYSFSVSGM